MKTLKTLLFVLAVSVLFTAGTSAQTQDIEVSATVQAALAFSSVSNLTFGEVTANTTAIHPANASSTLFGSEANNTNATSGQVTITGNAGVSITISYNDDTELSDGSNTVAFDPDIVTTGGTTIAQLGTSVSLSGTLGLGTVTLDIGGTLDQIVTAGNYSTTSGTPITLTVAYD